MNEALANFREHLAPQFSDTQLTQLRDALRSDDPRLVQGVTTLPIVRGPATNNAPVQAACAVGFCGIAAGLQTAGQVANYVAEAFLDRPLVMFVEWFDNQPRGEVFATLANEIDSILETRKV